MLLDPLPALGFQEWLLCNRSKQKYLSLSWLSSPAPCLKLEKYGIRSTRLNGMNTHALVTKAALSLFVATDVEPVSSFSFGFPSVPHLQ